jgi:glycosyltransferase involved in cell wall biosynthesis
MLEAAACGLPIIATNWSAHTEFLNLGKWVQIDYQLGQIHQSRVDDHIFVKNARWAFPSEENFKKRIKKFYNSSSIPKEWAKDLKEKITKEYSFENVSKKYDTVFKEIL